MNSNNRKVCVDIFTEKHKFWMHKYEFKKIRGIRSDYYSIKTDKKTADKIVKKCKSKRLKCRQYEVRWSRSSNYRSQFFKYYKPPYKCRYCRRSLSEDKMVIDHIVSIDKVKKNINARMLLYMQGIDNVNDVRNLAPSCHKCNDKKGEHSGKWVVRGILGKYKWYWIARRIIQILLILGLISLYLNGDDFLDYIISFFH